MEFSCAETTDFAESATTRTRGNFQRYESPTPLDTTIPMQVVRSFSKRNESERSVCRRVSSTLMSTRSSVNNASTSSRCSAHEKEWAVGSEQSYLEQDVGVHSFPSRQAEYQCTAASRARFFLCGQHFRREVNDGARIQHGGRFCSVSGG